MSEFAQRAPNLTPEMWQSGLRPGRGRWENAVLRHQTLQRTALCWPPPAPRSARLRALEAAARLQSRPSSAPDWGAAAGRGVRVSRVLGVGRREG